MQKGDGISFSLTTWKIVILLSSLRKRYMFQSQNAPERTVLGEILSMLCSIWHIVFFQNGKKVLLKNRAIPEKETVLQAATEGEKHLLP